MQRSIHVPVGILLTVLASSVWAQSNLGQLLDAGAIKVTAQEFRQQIVGRVVEGPSRGIIGGIVAGQEVVYLEGGSIRGSGQASIHGGASGGGQSFSIEGTWTIDEQQRVCQTTRAGSVVLAPRCQFWFKQSDKYFLSDSDIDRSAQLTLRSLKKM